jgi:hypothetical protein
MPSRQKQGLYWIATIPHHLFVPFLHEKVDWLKGQLESGAQDGYLHWQFCVHLKQKATIVGVKELYGPGGHYELTKSKAAESYCTKEETRVQGTSFELGIRPFKRNSSVDWAAIRDKSMRGEVDSIIQEFPDVAMRHYFSIRAIAKDYARPKPRPIMQVKIFHGPTGTGKSFKAFQEAGENYYRKSPSTKWWDGYRGEQNVVIDEFSGQIGICHLLQWLDKYPMSVEIKGGCVPLGATNFWITSNIALSDWYPEATVEHRDALRRRCNSVVHFNVPFFAWPVPENLIELDVLEPVEE